MRIGVDLDGCCYDYTGAVMRYLASIGQPRPFPESSEWGWYVAWGMTDEEFWSHANAGVEAGIIYAGPFFDGAADALRDLHDAGHELHFKTARWTGDGSRAEELTLDCLAENEIPYDSLTFGHDKTAGPECDLFVEDNVGNYDALEEVGVEPWLITQPYNLDQPGGKVRRRVSSLVEFADMVLERVAA